jgi:hypothetical protein
VQDQKPNQSDYKPGRGYSQEDWDEVSDNPEWTAEDFAKARPFAEVFPEIAEAFRMAKEAGEDEPRR